MHLLSSLAISKEDTSKAWSCALKSSSPHLEIEGLGKISHLFPKSL